MATKFTRCILHGAPKPARRSIRYILSHDENIYSNLTSKAKNCSFLRAASGQEYIEKTSSKPIHLNTAVSSE